MINWKNNIQIIGVDHGYGNMKTANCVFGTGVLAYDKEPVFKSDMLGDLRKYFPASYSAREMQAAILRLVQEEYGRQQRRRDCER